MKGTFILTSLFTVIASLSIGQPTVYEDYVGGGHADGIIVSASSSDANPNWTDNPLPEHTVDGEGLEGPRTEASRFLFQAAFGGTEEQIDRLAKTLDFEKWIDDQIDIPRTNMLQLTRQTYQQARQRYALLNGNADDYFYSEIHFQFAWWQAAMTKPDILRQRIALALSEIMVISTNSNIRSDGEGVASYYDVLMKHAFGNYRDLIEDITLHPSMGVFLSHFRNGKTDVENNTYPDENYAREIMQLFSIGLYELNTDGTLKTDDQGDPIPTYDDEDIRNMAKVMTGLGAGAMTQEGIDEGRDLNFFISARLLDYTEPMVMYESHHEPGEKIILGDKVIPAGQTGEEDLAMALDYLFEHPNVGPFLSYRLIQQLVKSNPSPGYIEDVAEVFNDNGDGVRGDLKAVIKAILLHEEARICEWSEHPENGKLKSPVGRYVQFARNFALGESDELFWTTGFAFEQNTYQLPLASPSVFNFYLPDHQPNGEIYEQGLYAPEFQIFNSVTSLGFANQVDVWVRTADVFRVTNLENTVNLKYEHLLEAAREPLVLVNELNTILCNGRLSNENTASIANAMSEINFGTDILKSRVGMALYLVMISPEYNIQK